MTTDQAAGLCILVIFLVLAGFFGWHLWDAYRIRLADRQWKDNLAEVNLPPWDGTDWPETGLVKFLDSTDELPLYDYQAKHGPDPVPVSQISGPFSILAGPDDDDIYIALMRERTDAFIALLSQPIEVTR